MGHPSQVRVVSKSLPSAAPQLLHVIARSTWRFLRPLLPTRYAADHHPGIPGRVHYDDPGVDTRSVTSTAVYRRVGLQAYQHIGGALQYAGMPWSEVRALLDYGCGYGRVLRWLSARHPEVRLVAADTDAAAVRFCAHEFNAVPLTVERDVARLDLSMSFNVIWVGSVLTQLRDAGGRELLDRLTDALEPGGIMLFTTRGELLTERVLEYGPLVAARASEIQATLAQGGVAFVGGDETTGPAAFHARTAVREHIASRKQCELLSLARRGWDDQDVWTIRKKPED